MFTSPGVLWDSVAAVLLLRLMPVHATRELVLKKLRDGFPDPEAARKALLILDTYGTESWHNEKDRVQLAILKECKGSLDRLRMCVDTAMKDFRDALVGAEYPEEFQASSKTPLHEMEAIRRRDREQYEAWLQSDGA